MNERDRFLELVADIRPDLHRYCARMTGSVVDGEDVVQDTLARAFYILPELEEMPPLRPWLFRIAHRRAIDFLRRYERRMSEPLETITDTAVDDAPEPAEALAREDAVKAALSRFAALAPLQRSCVILKDVLGHSLDDIAKLLETNVPAVKAALHRGRSRLRELEAEARMQADGPRPQANAALLPAGTQAPPGAYTHADKIRTRTDATGASREPSAVVAQYAKLFNARDWDGIRAMLAEDVRLDLVSRIQRTGPRQVGNYFSNYDKLSDWHLVPAWLEDREVIAVFRNTGDPHPSYFIELTTAGDQVTLIRDFRYVPYIAREATFDFMPERQSHHRHTPR
jgi:RNA polymerase sigma factor (sigma-70 family)